VLQQVGLAGILLLQVAGRRLVIGGRGVNVLKAGGTSDADRTYLQERWA
jgi:hypothetical protein